MNDIHTRSAEIAVRPRVSHVEQKDGTAASVDTGAGQAASSATATGNGRPVVDTVAIADDAAASRKSVEQAVAHLNDYVQSLQRDIQFSIDPELQQPVVRVVDRSTQEVIRQIPSETALRLARDLKDLPGLASSKHLNASDIALFRAQA